MEDFVKLVSENGGEGRTSAKKSVESHIMAFAAEYSRLNKEVVNIEKFWDEAIEKIKAEA
ncbi:hypothetical protein AAIB48_04045 [Paraclostridium benzoelyticum]